MKFDQIFRIFGGCCGVSLSERSREKEREREVFFISVSLARLRNYPFRNYRMSSVIVSNLEQIVKKGLISDSILWWLVYANVDKENIGSEKRFLSYEAKTHVMDLAVGGKHHVGHVLRVPWYYRWPEGVSIPLRQEPLSFHSTNILTCWCTSCTRI